MINKYRKKPIVIEAIQLKRNAESFKEAYLFIGNTCDFTATQDGTFINIKTLEGTMIARIGDYIIKGISGEYYPCKSDIFDKTYEVLK